MVFSNLGLLFRRDLLRGRERPYPNENYLSGNGMSTVWMGHGHYAPHNRQWQKHHEKIALPNEKVAGQIEFQTEDQWRDWTYKRDRPDSKHCGGMGRYFIASRLDYCSCLYTDLPAKLPGSRPAARLIGRIPKYDHTSTYMCDILR